MCGKMIGKRSCVPCAKRRELHSVWGKFKYNLFFEHWYNSLLNKKKTSTRNADQTRTRYMRAVPQTWRRSETNGACLNDFTEHRYTEPGESRWGDEVSAGPQCSVSRWRSILYVLNELYICGQNIRLWSSYVPIVPHLSSTTIQYVMRILFYRLLAPPFIHTNNNLGII